MTAEEGTMRKMPPEAGKRVNLEDDLMCLHVLIELHSFIDKFWNELEVSI